MSEKRAFFSHSSSHMRLCSLHPPDKRIRMILPVSSCYTVDGRTNGRGTVVRRSTVTIFPGVFPGSLLPWFRGSVREYKRQKRPPGKGRSKLGCRSIRTISFKQMFRSYFARQKLAKAWNDKGMRSYVPYFGDKTDVCLRYVLLYAEYKENNTTIVWAYFSRESQRKWRKKQRNIIFLYKCC